MDMRVTVSSQFNVPCVLPRGEEDGYRISQFAYEKGACIFQYQPGIKGNGLMKYVVEFNPVVGPELWTLNDLINQVWKEVEKARSL